MKDIQELIDTGEKYKHVVVQTRFPSKKNAVAYVTLKGKPRVLKWFAPGFKYQMETEYSILKKGSSKLRMPNVYERDDKDNVLILSYITGENLCDLVNDEKTTLGEKQRLMVLLGEWFAAFHIHFKQGDQVVIRGDSILHNFLFTDRIWGVDFEEARVGKPVEDIAGLCSSVLSTDPMFTSEKFELCTMFVESYREKVKWALEAVADEVAYALLMKIQWRPDDEPVLREWAQRIRKQGLALQVKS